MMNKKINVAQMREKYIGEGLSRTSLPETPYPLFEKWLAQYAKTGVAEPNAMIAATASKQAAPSQRTVLLKAYDEKGFVFHTNYGSRKAQQLAENNHISLLFPWQLLHRQVIIEGIATKISSAESLKYFLTRPRGSQLGAWASEQSSPINARAMLESKILEIKQKFKDKDISLPAFWGGYRVEPRRIEFWQAGTDRLHDRFLYTLNQKGKNQAGNWDVERLSP